MTQRERVLKMLEDAGPEGVLSKTFIASYMPRAAARIQELKDQGVPIVSEREGKYTRYTLVGSSGTVGLVGGSSPTVRPPEIAEEAGHPRTAVPTAPSEELIHEPRSVPSMFDADADWAA